MKKIILILLGGTLLLPAMAVAQSKEVYVSVRESQLRASPGFLAAPVTGVKYGDRLAVQGEQGEWMSVRTAARKTGFLHQSAVTTKQVVLKADAGVQNFSASSDNIVLAGKGFSADLEREYAENNAGMNYAAVNAMERNQVSEQQVKQFITQGKLTLR